MSTLRQKKLAKAIVENTKATNPLNAMQLLVSVGYKEVTARAEAGRTIEGKGVQEELIKYGFTEEKAKETVVKILDNNFVAPSDRLKAADMIFKVHGTYQDEPEKPKSVVINNFFINPKIQEATKLYDEQLKQALANETNQPAQTLPPS